ncbi:MAG: hypothetical protein ACLPTJ_17625 [Solirubrobacteraceae bacterium]
MSTAIGDNQRPRDKIRRMLLGVAAALVLAGALAGRAAAANQFALDARPTRWDRL